MLIGLKNKTIQPLVDELQTSATKKPFLFTIKSHRILKWNKRYFTEYKVNPFINMVYIACDCAHLPILTESVDMVTSCCGFESMQEKRNFGFCEAHRILKKTGIAIYDMSIVEDHNSQNSIKWIDSLKVSDGFQRMKSTCSTLT